MISDFRGEWAALSNFYACQVTYEGMTFKSVEHAYQAAKTLDHLARRRIQLADTPTQAKHLGRTVDLRPDWEEIKVDVMRGLLWQKFTRPILQDILLRTGNEELVEGNWWKDTFWGQCPVGNGQNWLGRLLMEIREEIRK